MQTVETTRRPNPMQAMAAGMLMGIANGYCRTQLLAVAARLGVADHLAGGPRSAEELAIATDAKPEPLRRVLRGLAAIGVFTETPDGLFRITDLSQQMRSDVPASVRYTLAMFGEDNYAPVGHILHTVRTGEVAFERVFGQPYYDWLSADQDAADTFAASMRELSALEVAETLATYDLSSLATIVDVGGGNGQFLSGILAAHPHLRGTVVDLPAAVETAPAVLAAHGVSDRCEVVGGDFLRELPAGRDAYLLKHVLHNWDDESGVRILAGCLAAMGPDGRVVVVERTLPDRVEQAPSNEIATLMDTVMLAKHTGRTRTEREYRQLLEDAGFHVASVQATPARITILDGRPA